MSTKYLEANDARRGLSKRNTSYAGSEYGDSDEELVNEKSFYDDEKRIRHLEPSATDSSLKSISHEDHAHHTFYKPFSNRTPVLSIFLLAIGACILLMELAIRTHPSSDVVKSVLRRDLDSIVPNEPFVRVSQSLYSSSKHVRRSSEEVTIFTFHADTSVSSTQDNVATPTSSEPLTGAPNPNKQLTTTTPSPDADPDSSATTSAPMPGEPNPNNQLITSEPASNTATPQPDPNSQITTVTPQPNPDNQLVTSTPPPPGQPNPNSQLTETSQNNGGSPTSMGVTVGSPAPNSQLVTAEPNSNTNGSGVSASDKVVATVTGSNGMVSVVTSAVQQASLVSGSLIASGSSIIGTVNSLLTNSNGQATATSRFTGTVVLTNSNGQATATVSYAAPQAVAPTSASDSANLQQNSVAWTKYSYFLAQYFPNIVAVILQATWLIIFATFKMMEPFYQLASPRGASAESSLTADYLSAGLSLAFIKAAIDGHWVMVLSGLVQLFLALTVTLASDAFNVVPTAFCKTQLTDTQPCAPRWVVNLRFARGVEVLLIGCFSMVLMIIVLNLHRVSGVYTDPSKIATMADVLVHKPFIQELRDIPASATKAEVELDLKDNRYMLGTFIIHGREHYGIVKLSTPPQSFEKDPYMVRLGRRFDFWWEGVVRSFEEHLPYASDFVCMLLALALFSIVLAYYLIPGTDDTNPLNNFMGKDKSRFGASFLLSMLAVSMGFLLKHKERAYRLSHPYVVMSKGPQPASQCITTGMRSTQYTALPKSIYSRDITLALLSMAAILSDMNLLLVPGIPWTPSQTAEVYKASTYGCLVILTIVLLVHARVTFKQWRRGHHVENPDTLAAVLMRLCGSRFVEEKNWQASHGPISRSEFWQDDDQRQRLRYEGVEKERKYKFGCMEGVDGVQRYMIEEDVWPRKTLGSARTG